MSDTRAVYVVLTDTGTWLSRLIGCYTGQQLNHASLAFDEQLREVYSFGRKNPANPFMAGFVRENMHGDWFLRRREVPCAIYRCAVSGTELRRIRHYVRQLDNRRDELTYNLLGLLFVAAGIRFERRNAFFCSQFVAEALASGGVRVTDKPPCLTTPQDLASSARLRPVFRGTLRQYLMDAPRGMIRPGVAGTELDPGAAFSYNRVRTTG